MLRIYESAGADKNHFLEIGSPEYNKIRYPGTPGRNDMKPAWIVSIQRDKLLKQQGRWKHSLLGQIHRRNGHPAKRAIIEDLAVCIKNGLKLKTRTFEYEPSTGELQVEGKHIGVYDAKQGGLASFTLRYTNTALARLRLRDFGIDLVKKNAKTYWKMAFYNASGGVISRYVLNHPNLKWWFKKITYTVDQSGNSVILKAELFENIRYNVNFFSTVSSTYTYAHTFIKFAYPELNTPAYKAAYYKAADVYQEFYRYIDSTFCLPEAAEQTAVRKFLKPILNSVLSNPVAISYFLGRITGNSVRKYVDGIPDNVPYIGTSEKLKLHQTLCLYNGIGKTSWIAFVLVSALESNVKVILKSGTEYNFPIADLAPNSRVSGKGYVSHLDSFESMYLLAGSRPGYLSSQIRLVDDTKWEGIEDLVLDFTSSVTRALNPILISDGNLLNITRSGKMVEPFLGKEILISSTEYTDLIR